MSYTTWNFYIIVHSADTAKIALQQHILMEDQHSTGMHHAFVFFSCTQVAKQILQAALVGLQ